jgi:hypothetical protein
LAFAAACRDGARELCPQLIFVGGHFKIISGWVTLQSRHPRRLHAARRTDFDRRGFCRCRGLHASLRLTGEIKREFACIPLQPPDIQ